MTLRGSVLSGAYHKALPPVQLLIQAMALASDQSEIQSRLDRPLFELAGKRHTRLPEYPREKLDSHTILQSVLHSTQADSAQL